MRERKVYKRVPLRCLITLWNPCDGAATFATTEEISCDSLYCVCNGCWTAGEELYGKVTLPGGKLTLHCKLEVTRFIRDGVSDRSTVVFRILEYNVMRPTL